MSFWIRTAERPDSTHFYYFSKTIDIDVNDASAIRAFTWSSWRTSQQKATAPVCAASLSAASRL